MNYKSFNLGDWIGHISGVIEDETTLDGNEMRDLVEFLSTLEQEPIGYKTQYENYLKKSEVVISQLRADRDRLQDAFDKVDEIITDALDKSTDQKESQTLRWVLDKISEVM
jgi:hypothetical protein